MKLWFLGTCSGTEPIPNRNHSSFLLISQGHVYWFDAGEGCSRTAYLSGVDLLAVDKIVISHTHIDHIGGLCNLLWNIRKISHLRGHTPPYYGDIDLYIPTIETWEGASKILRNTQHHFEDSHFSVFAHKTEEGILFDDGIVKVTAFHTCHMPPENEVWTSYAFLIECEEKRLVFSGDMGSHRDLLPLLENGCDTLVIETGHFSLQKTYDFLCDKNVKQIFFTHHGTEILHDPDVAQKKLETLFGSTATLCYDGMSVEL